MFDIRNLWKKPIAPFVSQCMCRTKVEQNVVDEFYAYGKMPNDPHLKCYFYCLTDKVQVFPSPGEVDVKKWSDTFDYLDIALAHKCADIKEADVCQTTYLMIKCVHDELSKWYPQ